MVKQEFLCCGDGRCELPGRDLRLLDPRFVYPSTILGREKAIVVNLESLRCIITADEVLLLNTDSPTVQQVKAPSFPSLLSSGIQDRWLGPSQHSGTTYSSDEFSGTTADTTTSARPTTSASLCFQCFHQFLETLQPGTTSFCFFLEHCMEAQPA